MLSSSHSPAGVRRRFACAAAVSRSQASPRTRWLSLYRSSRRSGPGRGLMRCARASATPWRSIWSALNNWARSGDSAPGPVGGDRWRRRERVKRSHARNNVLRFAIKQVPVGMLCRPWPETASHRPHTLAVNQARALALPAGSPVGSTLAEHRDRLQHAVTLFRRLASQRREFRACIGDARIREPVEQVADQGQSPALLVVEVDQRPRRVFRVRGLQHRLAGTGVVGVFPARLDVDRRQLPALERVGEAFGEAFFLLRLVAAQPVLEQQDPVVDKLLLEQRRILQESLDLRSGGEAHHLLDAGTVVPAAIEQNEFAGGRQVRHVALEVPLRRFALTGLGQRGNAALARIDVFADRVDRATLAGGVAAFEQHHHALALVLQPVRHRRQFFLQWRQQFLVVLALELAHRLPAFALADAWPAIPRATSSSAPCWRVLSVR